MTDRTFDRQVKEIRRRSLRWHKMIGSTSRMSQVSGSECSKYKTSKAGIARRAAKNEAIGGGSGEYSIIKCVNAQSDCEYQGKLKPLVYSHCKRCRSAMMLVGIVKFSGVDLVKTNDVNRREESGIPSSKVANSEPLIPRSSISRMRSG